MKAMGLFDGPGLPTLAHREQAFDFLDRYVQNFFACVYLLFRLNPLPITRSARAWREARALAKDEPIKQRFGTIQAFNNTIGFFPTLIGKETLAKFEALEVEIGGEPGVCRGVCVYAFGWVASHVGTVLHSEPPPSLEYPCLFTHKRSSVNIRTNTCIPSALVDALTAYEYQVDSPVHKTIGYSSALAPTC